MRQETVLHLSTVDLNLLTRGAIVRFELAGIQVGLHLDGAANGHARPGRSVGTENPFACDEPGCGRTFKLKNGLGRHLSTTHGRTSKRAAKKGAAR